MTIRYRILRLLGYKTMEEALQDREAGRISGIGPRQMRQARALTLAGFPLNLKFPKEGQIYKARIDAEVFSTIHFMAPMTGGGRIKIPRDTRVIISDNDAMPTVIYFRLVDSTLENVIVSDENRKDPAYDGYSLSTDTLDFINKFEPDGEE